MNRNPLVTIICLCYNHRRFIKEAIESVLVQTYDNIELIIIDDASTDGSQEVIEQIIDSHPEIKYFPLKENRGNCRAFNYGLTHAKGEFIIDFAADDIFKPNRIEEGVNGFIEKGPEYGVNFSDAEIINEDGDYIKNFYLRYDSKLSPKISQGYVYADLLERYFICPPTLMCRKIVFDKLNGYDESLAYEDFDFLLRAAKKYKFFFTDQVLVERRIVEGSMSSLQYKKGSAQMWSTYQICKKAKQLNSNKKEDNALKKRIIYEARKSLETGDLKLFYRYIKLYFGI
ncbi:MAG: glycosyltransferase family 2 protein [Candidatus Cyclobacteriaceae bacterium M2_1C_046]